jgi:ATP-dependent HslUV protease ATP-binding subunit HslU
MSHRVSFDLQADLTPARIVHLLNQYIIGQEAAKRSVAVAVRNRWRRQQLEADLRQEVNPKNILLIGPTGVGKTEIARRLARITGAPFIKVEATKFTEVGYYGRDVESMIRELVENAIMLVKKELQVENEATAQQRCEERLLDLLCGRAASPDEAPPPKSTGQRSGSGPSVQSLAGKKGDGGLEILATLFGLPSEASAGSSHSASHSAADPPATGGPPVKPPHDPASSSSVDGPDDAREPDPQAAETAADTAAETAASGSGESQTEDSGGDPTGRFRQKMKQKLLAGQLEERVVEFRIEQKSNPLVFGPMGGDTMDRDMQSMLEKFLPKSTKTKKTTVKEARKILFEQEFEKLIDEDQVNTQAIGLAENLGIIFLDEIDKLVASEGKGADVSRQGVQRDLLPLVEGTIVSTRYGQVKTDHILFIAAGAFHKNQPSDLMPELQGRFPIRVELSNLVEDDFVRILSEPSSSLTQQYTELLATEGVRLEFSEDGIRALARCAFQLNQTTQNIGARRLHTLLEKVLEEISFSAPDLAGQTQRIDADYVNGRLQDLLSDQDLSRFIL